MRRRVNSVMASSGKQRLAPAAMAGGRSPMLLIQGARQKVIPRRIIGTSCRNAEPRAAAMSTTLDHVAARLVDQMHVVEAGAKPQPRPFARARGGAHAPAQLDLVDV